MLKGGRCKHAIFSYDSTTEWFCGPCTDGYCSCQCSGCVEGTPTHPYDKGKAILIVRPSGYPKMGSGRSEGWWPKDQELYATDQLERQGNDEERSGVHRSGATSTNVGPAYVADEGPSGDHVVPDRYDSGTPAVHQASASTGTFLPYESAKNLIQLIIISEAAAQASGRELAQSMKQLTTKHVHATPWTLIMTTILFVFILGCCLGAFICWLACRQKRHVVVMTASSTRAPESLIHEDAGGAAEAAAPADTPVVSNMIDLRRRPAASMTPAVRRPCAHSRNQKVNGSNQWIDRLLCLNCGVTFDQDTRLNIERMAALASRAMRSASITSPLMNPSSEQVDEIANGNGLPDTSLDAAVRVVEFEG